MQRSRSFYERRYRPEQFIDRIEKRLEKITDTIPATQSSQRATSLRLESKRPPNQRKPRILQVFNNYLERGGEEVWVNEMLHLCKNDFEIYDLRFHSRTWKGDNAPNRIIQAARLWSNPHSRDLLREAVMLHQPDVLIFHNLIPVASLGLYDEAALLGIPVIQFAHNFRPFSVSGTLWFNGQIRDEALYGNRWPEIIHGAWEGSILKTALLALYFNRLAAKGTFTQVARWVTVSDFMREKFVDGGMDPRKVTTLRHCWHPKEPSKLLPELDYYLFLGRLVPEKGVSVLLETWELLKSQLGDACPRLIIAGSGTEDSWIKQSCTNQQNVSCVGFVDGEQKERLIAQSRALIAPSIWWEPLGLIVYEAYDHGRPVLAAASGGLQETVQPGNTGFLHAPGNAAALCEDVVQMEKIGMKGRRTMGVNGRQWLLEQASSARWIEALKKIVQEVTGASSVGLQ